MNNGSIIGSVAYERTLKSGEKKYIPIGSLIYFRTHDEDVPPSVKIRLDLIPVYYFKNSGDLYLICNFRPSEKIPEPPYVDGDITAATGIRGQHVTCGHIHTRQNESSKKNGEYEDHATQYFGELYGIPVLQWRRIIKSENERKAMYLTVETE